MSRQRPWFGTAIVGAALAAGVAATSAGPARAAATGCLFYNGALVVPAILDRAGGDWLIDIASPTTLLHETRAQMEGIEAPATVGSLRFDGERLDALAVAVANLDARAPGFDTPIVGVIGADVLGRYVVDIDFSPCRVTLYLPGHAPRLAGAVLPLTMVQGRPTVRAAVSDGTRALSGAFVLDTASRAAVRLAIAAPRPEDRGDARQAAPSWIRALSVAGTLYERPPAARAAELPAGLAGALGTGMLSRYHVRIDIPGGRLTLAPALATAP